MTRGSFASIGNSESCAALDADGRTWPKYLRSEAVLAYSQRKLKTFSGAGKEAGCRQAARGRFDMQFQRNLPGVPDFCGALRAGGWSFLAAGSLGNSTGVRPSGLAPLVGSGARAGLPDE
jgi:hypothetical protein